MQGIRDTITCAVIGLGFVAFLIYLMVTWHPPFGPAEAVMYASVWAVLGLLVGRERDVSVWRRLRRGATGIAVISALILAFGVYVRLAGNGYGTDYDDLREVGMIFLGFVILAVLGFAVGFGIGGDRGPDENQG